MELLQFIITTPYFRGTIYQQKFGIAMGSPVSPVKAKICRMKTHTDYYLNFSSHYPLHQKLGIIKILVDRCNNIITELENRWKEEEHITRVLQECGYLKWTIRKEKKQENNIAKEERLRIRTIGNPNVW